MTTFISIFSYGLGSVGLMLNITNYFCIWYSLRYFTFFIIGMRLRQHRESITMRVPLTIYILLDIVLFIICQIIKSYEGVIFKLLLSGLNYTLNICGAFAAFYGLQTLANKINWQNNKIFKALSSKSMPIYLFHQQIIYFTILLFNGKVNPYINSILNFVIALTFSFTISYVMMNFKLTRFLLGEK